jgi:hypothetical protein
MTAVPVRFPEQWSADWFRRFYAEVLAADSVSGATVSEVNTLIAQHNTDTNAHPSIPRTGSTGVSESYAFFVGA